jgi:hypothetical protein
MSRGFLSLNKALSGFCIAMAMKGVWYDSCYRRGAVFRVESLGVYPCPKCPGSSEGYFRCSLSRLVSGEPKMLPKQRL